MKTYTLVIVVLSLLYISACTEGKKESKKEGYIEVEAESFNAQKNNEIRSWLIRNESSEQHEQDLDSMEYKTASNSEYLELLPDTRVTHDDELIKGINFNPEPGFSILEYKVNIEVPGKYYVWVRAFSTGPEDNGIHVGIDGTWPESGKRMQWCEGKNEWTWASKQRTKEVHCGENEKIFLDINEVGEHTIQFSMREDGFAFDKFVLTTKYEMPKDEI
ncbi:MAG: hypothetical protein JXR07_19140 [Reichenbachiella sp.]